MKELEEVLEKLNILQDLLNKKQFIYKEISYCLGLKHE